MEGKKISFGFLKTKKLEKPVVEEKKDYIECVEEKSIKVVGGETVEEITPLIIPMKPNTLITAERLKEIAEKVEKSLDEPETEKEKESQPVDKPPENETLDQMAVRELLQDAKKEVKVETSLLTVPVQAKPVMDGEKEATLDDYESVPIQDYGLAMLRGMGWTPGKEQSKYKQPQLRQKGLGLGADKVVKENQSKKSSKDKEEDLAIVKNSFVKITTGKYNGYYGKVVSLDEDNGRVMVEIPVKKETISLIEFMMHPVTKSEFDKESKVLNADSYEQYKKNEKSEKKTKIDESPKVNESEATSSQKPKDRSPEYKDKREKYKKDDTSSNGKNRDRSHRHRRDSSSSEDRSRQRRKDTKKLSKRDSSTSHSDNEKRRKHKNSRRRHSKSESNDSDSHKKERRRRSRTPEGKRDIDKKRKGKKKKRDRDRSPNYRKHRK